MGETNVESCYDGIMAIKKGYGKLLGISAVALVSLICCMSVIVDFDYIGTSGDGNGGSGRMMSSTNLRRGLASNHKSVFLYAIFSTKQEKKRREMIRNTILTSLPPSELCPLHEYLRAIDTHRNNPPSCRIVYTFVVGNIEGDEGPTEHLPGNDSPVYINPTLIPNSEPDVVYLNIRENMNEGKTPTFFKYASGLVDTYNIDFVGKADSDTFMWMPNLLHFMDRDLSPRPINIEDDNRRYFGGIMVDEGICGGEEVEYCKKLFGKVYMGGQFYFVSSDLTKFLSSKQIDRSIPVPHEDYDFGVRVLSHPLPIKLIPLSGYRFWQHGRDLKAEEGWMAEWERVSAAGEAPIRNIPQWWPQVTISVDETQLE